MVNKSWLALLHQKTVSVFYATGMNYYNIDLNGTSLHAEVDAVNKLKSNSKNQKKKINVIVLRTNNKGDRFMMAQSCQPCLNYMKQELDRKNYKVHTAWYSNEEGLFTKFNI